MHNTEYDTTQGTCSTARQRIPVLATNTGQFFFELSLSLSFPKTFIIKSNRTVSIFWPLGNYGNKFDESVAPANTPPSNAVFDGCKYYYLPWTEDKSCTCVEAYWEDITFRLEPLNAMHRIIDQLVNELCLSFGRLHWLYTVNPRVLKQNLFIIIRGSEWPHPVLLDWTLSVF